jgi:hypothetical protein
LISEFCKASFGLEEQRQDTGQSVHAHKMDSIPALRDVLSADHRIRRFKPFAYIALQMAVKESSSACLSCKHSQMVEWKFCHRLRAAYFSTVV